MNLTNIKNTSLFYSCTPLICYVLSSSLSSIVILTVFRYILIYGVFVISFIHDVLGSPSLMKSDLQVLTVKVSSSKTLL